MKILITGSEGFVGKNLKFFLNQKKIYFSIFNKTTNTKDLKKLILNSDIIIHLAGQNRGGNKKVFFNNNLNITKKIVMNLPIKKKKYIIYASSIKYNEKSFYGISKKNAEMFLLKNKKFYNYDLSILRLPNLFGKWCKPNYNSVIATFCNNIAKNKNIILKERNKKIEFLYIDDLLNQIFLLLKKKKKELYPKIRNTYHKSINCISKKLLDFKNQKSFLNLNIFANSFDKKLYSTYLTYIPARDFFYKINGNIDTRGNFSELIRSDKFGQISFFTIRKKQVRGGHYHSSKVERFFPISGSGYIIYKSILNNKIIKIKFNEKKILMIQTIPGWLHTIYNTGNKNCIFICWSNEVFNIKKPDTYFVNE
jgi:UDP-2-acetamido-2,6-beta-L-arabino-hexul-4-ose reductase